MQLHHIIFRSPFCYSNGSWSRRSRIQSECSLNWSRWSPAEALRSHTRSPLEMWLPLALFFIRRQRRALGFLNITNYIIRIRELKFWAFGGVYFLVLLRLHWTIQSFVVFLYEPLHVSSVLVTDEMLSEHNLILLMMVISHFDHAGCDYLWYFLSRHDLTASQPEVDNIHELFDRLSFLLSIF
jgi:hypothetical protein